jgi:hypothetical protein
MARTLNLAFLDLGVEILNLLSSELKLSTELLGEGFQIFEFALDVPSRTALLRGGLRGSASCSSS